MPAPLAAGVSAQSAIGNFLGGGPQGAGVDQVRAQLEALAGQVSNIKTMLDAIGADFPNAAAEIERAKGTVNQILMKVAQQIPEQTASGSAVPTGGSMSPNPAA